MKHYRSRDRAALVEQKHQTLSAPDKTPLQNAFLIHRALQLRRHWVRAVLRVAGNANRLPAQAFNPVMAALGLYVDQTTTRQARAIYKFRRCHSLSRSPFTYR